MFHFPTFPPHALCVQARVTPHDWCGVPPFGNPRINARLTAPRGLSQPPTSFIGSWCQGIHRAPLKTWPHTKNPHPTTPRRDRTSAGIQIHAYKMLASTVQFSRYGKSLHNTHRQPRSPGRYDRHEALQRQQPTPTTASAATGPARSLRTQQRAYDLIHPPTCGPDPPPRETRDQQAVLAASTSTRPNWSAFHP
jgi:hypothetical protein